MTSDPIVSANQTPIDPRGEAPVLRTWRIRDWPEVAGLLVGVVGYAVIVALYRPDASVTGYPAKPFRLLESLLTIVLVLSLIWGAGINYRSVPQEYQRFWSRLRIALWTIFFSQVFVAIAYQVAPLAYDRPGVYVSPATKAAFGASALLILVSFVILTVAVFGRVRQLANNVRSRAIFLDAAAGAITIATLIAMVFAESRPTSSAWLVVALVSPMAIIYSVILVASLALVALARARHLPGETEFCIAGAMVLSIIAATNFMYQTVNIDSTPRMISVTYWILVAAGLASISERLTWKRVESGEIAVEETDERVLGAIGPVILAFLLPVIVIALAGAGASKARIAIGLAGTAIVGGVVLFRLVMTLRQNARLVARLEEARGTAERYAEEATVQAEIAASLLDRATHEQEDERLQLALRLHDEFLQGLSAVHVRLRTALRKTGDEAEQSRGLLSKGVDALEEHIDGIRELMSLLRPPVLEELGLPAALRQLLAGCEAAGLKTEFEEEGEVHVSVETELTLFRIAQQSIANVLTHSGSESVKIRLHSKGERVVMEIIDKGGGFTAQPELDLLAEGKVGIASMRKRAEMSGVDLAIESSPSSGTRVVAVARRIGHQAK